MERLRKHGIYLILALAMSVTFLLSACDDAPEQGNKSQYVQDAVNAVNGGTPIPVPTVDPQQIINLQLFLGQVDYTRQKDPAPKVVLFVLNTGRTTIYISSCEGTILQRNENSTWLNIAAARPCGTKPQPLELKPGLEYNLSFEFLKASPYRGQSFYVDGKYRLVVNFATACPLANADYSQCINRNWVASSEFDLFQLPQ
jgi:hypothetical protein